MDLPAFDERNNRTFELVSEMGDCRKVVIPEVVIGNLAVDVKNWVPDNDFGNDDPRKLLNYF